MVNEFFDPELGEAIENCVVPDIDPDQVPLCVKCAQPAYRILIIGKLGSAKRKVPLCGRHFINACIKYPEVGKFSRRGKMG